jgi:membrane-associated protease RseP (regulator of RpoE activity)
VTPNGSRYPVYRIPELPPEAHFYAYLERARPRPRYWLHLLLLVLTLLTTTVAGAGMAQAFRAGQPFRIDDIYGYQQAWNDPSYLWQGLPFSLTLVGVLLAHELGHYFTARYYLVDASLPYFLPVPTLIGTFGAFIRIRSAILSKRILFDVGIAGPLAGFATLLVPLVAGVALSRVAPGVNAQGDVVFGIPLLVRAVEAAVFPGVAPEDIYLHPMARAAWVGVLATALNLLPIGQLDGGHIVYAFLGERTKYLSWLLVAVLVPMGLFFAHSWLLWAALLLFFGLKHPSLVDATPVGPARARLAVLAAAIFAVSFTPSPVQ